MRAGSSARERHPALLVPCLSALLYMEVLIHTDRVDDDSEGE
jgi:hypothetical protein